MHPTRDYQSGQTSESEFVLVWAHLKPDPVSRDTYFPPDTMSREKELVSCFTWCLALLAHWTAFQGVAQRGKRGLFFTLPPHMEFTVPIGWSYYRRLGTRLGFIGRGNKIMRIFYGAVMATLLLTACSKAPPARADLLRPATIKDIMDAMVDPLGTSYSSRSRRSPTSTGSVKKRRKPTQNGRTFDIASLSWLKRPIS